MTSRAPVSRVQRETRRADTSRALARLLVEHDISDSEVERLTSVPRQHVAQWRDPDDSRSVSLADAIALPPAMRRALAEWLVGPGHVVAEIPDAAPAGSIAQALEVQRETTDVVTAHLAAIVDGHLTRAEATVIRREIHEAQRSLSALDHVCVLAEREGIVSTTDARH